MSPAGRSVLLLAAIAGTLIAARPAAARIIGRSSEINIGRETAAQVEKFFPCDQNAADVARVRAIGRRLAGSSNDADFPFEFHVIENPQVNAFALPGGFVYVCRGLLQLVPNDDALAFILGHEISHVTQHHSIRQFEKNALLNIGITAVLAGTGAPYSVGNAADVAAAVASISFTRHDEAEADRRGIALVVRAGYDPRAAVEAMRIIQRVGSAEKGTPELLRTHPAPESRIHTLTVLAESLAKEREKNRAAAPEPAEAPPPAPAASLPGLKDLKIAPCEWFPLSTGARWNYRVTSASGEGTVVVRILEPASSGAFRAEIELDQGIHSTRLYATTADRCLSAPTTLTAASAWREEAAFPAGAPTEKITVPAGEYEALRIEKKDVTGAVESVSWYARGVGLVKRVNNAAGTTQELTSYIPPKAP